MLQSVRERMESASSDIAVSFREAVRMVLRQQEVTAKELNLTFLTRVGARYWVPKGQNIWGCGLVCNIMILCIHIYSR